MSGKLRVQQVRSVIGRPEKQRKVMRGLGLRRINQTVVVDNTPAFRGMVKKVIHLVQVEQIDG